MVIAIVGGGAAWFLLGWGLVCLVSGILFRAGRLRYMATMYLAPAAPPAAWLRRNAPFALIYIGVAFVCFFGACIGATYDAVGAVGALATIGFVLSIVSFVFTLSPPDFVKPAWIREYDHAMRRAP